MQLEREHAAAAVVSTLRGAVEVGDWALAGEAAWALELMAGYSRSLTRAIRWVLPLLVLQLVVPACLYCL